MQSTTDSIINLRLVKVDELYLFEFYANSTNRHPFYYECSCKRAKTMYRFVGKQVGFCSAKLHLPFVAALYQLENNFL